MPDEIQQLRRSWMANANVWTDTVRNDRIESRRVVTNAAIVEAVLESEGRQVLDLGCGEGWLARALTDRGCHVTGTDASAALIEKARERGGGVFLELDYEQVASGALNGSRFDTIVANFSLLDDRIEEPLRALRSVLTDDGRLLIQTIHPVFARGDGVYADGWRTETFDALPGEWPEPMPLYFRTIGSCIRVITAAGYAIVDVREPLHPETGAAASILFIAGASPSRRG